MQHKTVHVIGIRKGGKLDTDATFFLTDYTKKFRKFEIKKYPQVTIEVTICNEDETLIMQFPSGILPLATVQELTEKLEGGTNVITYMARFCELRDTVLMIEE